MFSSAYHYQKPNTTRPASTLLKYLSQRTLAVLMFIALALLASVAGKKSEANQPSLDKSTSGDLVIRHRDHDACSVATKSLGPKKFSLLTSWQSIAAMMNSFKEAFNDPSIIDYANQQGIGIADSPTAPLLDTSSHSAAPSKSPSSQSSRFSSNY
jgi:hypothetical protein